MPIDWDAGLDDIYNGMGIPAVLDLGSDGTFDLTVLDKRVGVMLESQHGGQLFAAENPKAQVRVTELDENQIDRVSLKGATITFSGKTWRIKATEPLPRPGSKGHLVLILQTP